jgi:serine protease Do
MATMLAQKAKPSSEGLVKELGLTVQSLTAELAEQFAVEKSTGVIVTEVESGSPGEGKVSAGDIITEVNQKGVSSAKDFKEVMKKADLKKGVIINFTSKGTSKFEVLKKQ